ncbi:MULTISPECIES: MFS transporter [unclassified Paenibacillus]|uniref:MFS transporter n=1 Tax=unclassified Paenibacillus TaxID=185978 RepID=UPI00070B5D83|nr:MULTISPECIES: MFS transporter [unclassified Paenibacillus]KQX48784.1 arabinose ABC transporter permease [Paenibacillus sp. Root444D2]KRE36404.1 arabinose ABC transporter permease [Paenibacillus sp. Soil724D2]
MKKSYISSIIAIGIFGIINTELGVVGTLPQITQHFRISVSQAGLLVSLFALVIAIFGPFMTLLFSGVNRKNILAGVLAIFAISNLGSAFAPNYTVLLLFRILPAFLHPVYFSVAFTAAASSVPKDQSTKAVAKVFTGVTVGMVLGIPITSFIGNQFSLESSFLFSAVINAITCMSILSWIPSMPVKEKMSYGKQLKVLVKPQLWFNIATACLIMAALFAVYSYFAEYLGKVTNMKGTTISVMLILFGASGVYGNLQTGKLLSKSIVKTTIFYPLVLGMIYLLIFYAGTYTIPMIVIIIVWGAVFTSGLIISQTWLTSEASEAPEFANSLFVSFGNLGVSLGTTSGGWFLSQMGTHQIIWSGVLFLMLAFICIGLKIRLFDPKRDKILLAKNITSNE